MTASALSTPPVSRVFCVGDRVVFVSPAAVIGRRHVATAPAGLLGPATAERALLGLTVKLHGMVAAQAERARKILGDA